MEQPFILFAKFYCPMTRQNFSVYATAHACEAGLYRSKNVIWAEYSFETERGSPLTLNFWSNQRFDSHSSNKKLKADSTQWKLNSRRYSLLGFRVICRRYSTVNWPKSFIALAKLVEAILWWVAKFLAAEKDARLLDKAAERPDVVTSHAAELPDAVVWQAAELQGIVASQAAEILDAVVGQPAEIPDLAAYQDCGSPDSVAWQVAELPGYLAWPYRGPIFSKTCAICGTHWHFQQSKQMPQAQTSGRQN